MRYINLLDRVSRVKTMWCFFYNNTIIFVVPERLVHQAVGFNGKNVKAIQQMLGKRIKVVQEMRGPMDARRFIQDIVDPLSFRSVEMAPTEVILTAGGANKAALIGRNKVRLAELGSIVEDVFGKQLRIV